MTTKARASADLKESLLSFKGNNSSHDNYNARGGGKSPRIIVV